MTAAHCTNALDPFDVLVGEHNTNKTDDQAQVIQVKKFYQHSDYNQTTLNMDFALLELQQDLNFSSYVRPACLPQDASKDYTGVKAIVSGWGVLDSNGCQPARLQKLQVEVTANNECGDYVDGLLTENMMCAINPGKDSCQGDSGGPLVTEVNGRYTLIGVVSWGLGCADPNYPGVYARVTKVLDWVNEITSGVETCYPEAL